MAASDGEGRNLRSSRNDASIGSSPRAGSGRGLLWLLLVALAISVGAYLIFLAQRQTITDEAYRLLAGVNEQTRRAIGEWRFEREEMLRRVARRVEQDPAVAAAVNGGAESAQWQSFIGELGDLVGPRVRAVVLFDAQGAPRLVRGETQAGRAELDALARRALAAQQVIYGDNLQSTPRVADLRVALVMPVTAQGRVVGALGVLEDPRAFLNTIIVWPKRDSSGEQLLARVVGGRTFYINAPRGASPERVYSLPTVPTLLAAQRGERLRGINGSRVEALGASLPVADTPWVLITKVDESEVFATVAELARWITLVAVALVVAAGGMLLMRWRKERADFFTREARAQLQRQLLESRFDYLAKYANDAIFLADAQQRIQEVNDRALELYGYSRREFYRLYLWQLRGRHAAEASSGEGAASELFETTHRTKDGREFPVEVSARRIEADGGYLQAIVRDITARKQQERILRHQSDMYAALSRANEVMARGVAGELLPELCRIAVDEAGYAVAFVVLIEADGGTRIAAAHGLPPEAVAEAAAEEGRWGLVRQVVQGGEATAMDDLPDEGSVLGRLGFRSAAAAPLVIGDELRGVFGVVCAEGGWFNEIQLRLLDDFARDVAQGLEKIDLDERRREAERVMRESEARFRTLVGNMRSGVLVLVRDGDRFVVRDLNGALERMERVPRAAAIGASLVEAFPWSPQCLLPLLERVWHSTGVEGLAAHCHAGEHLGWREAYVFRLPTAELVAVIDDVTQRIESTEARRVIEERLTLVLDAIQESYWDFNFASGEFYFSRQFAEMFGRGPSDFNQGMNIWPELIHPSDVIDVQRQLADHLAGKTDLFISEHRMRHAQRGYIWVRARGKVVQRDQEGRPLRMVGTHHDVTAERKAAEQLRLWATVFEHSREAIMITDAQRRIISVNRAFTEITGYSLDEVRGSDPRTLSSGVHDRAFYQTLWSSVAETGHWSGEIQDRRKNGEIFPLWLAISTARDHDEIRNYIAIGIELGQLQAVSERTRYLAYHDALTGLPNRTLLNDRLAFAMARAQRHGYMVAVLFLDLDRFKEVNEVLGYAAGDRVLIAVAERLRGAIRLDDTVGRQGSDEFLVLLAQLAHPTDAIAVAHKALEEIGRPYRFDDTLLHVTPSIGIALYPGDADQVDELIRKADAAMYSAKERGRNNFQFCADELNRRAQSRDTLERQLRRALERGEFLLHYQPKIELASGRVMGVEALLRWRRNGDVVLPAEFIALAEETGLILPMGEWVLREACRQQNAWVAAGLPRLPVAVNLSLREFRQRGLADRVHDLLHGCAAPHSMEVEFTEATAMDEVENSRVTVRALKEAGIATAIGNFGVDRTRLSELRRLPVDSIKVSRTLVRDLGRSATDQSVVTAIVDLARGLGARVIAEGVEDAASLAVLRARGCDEAQGQHLSPPLAARQFETWWRERPPA